MNITGNARYKLTEETIEKAVFNLLRHRDYDNLTIKEICYEAGINRTTFYAHYLDINDLMLKIEENLTKKLHEVYKPKTIDEVNEEDLFIGFFQFVYDHKNFYRAFLKSHRQSFSAKVLLKKTASLLKALSNDKGFYYNDTEIEYHINFFGGGIKAVCGRWIANNCRETPQEMAKIIRNEYVNNALFTKGG
jgi:AcrR family transcriptional regulator